MRFGCYPETMGYGDYSTSLQVEYCAMLSQKQRGAAMDAAYTHTHRSNSNSAEGDGEQRQSVHQRQPTVQCSAPSAGERCTPPDGNVFASNASAEFNLFISGQVEKAIASSAKAAKEATNGKGRSKEGNLPTEILLEDTDGLRRPP